MKPHSVALEEESILEEEFILGFLPTEATVQVPPS